MSCTSLRRLSKIKAYLPALLQALIVFVAVRHPIRRLLTLAFLTFLQSGFIRRPLGSNFSLKSCLYRSPDSTATPLPNKAHHRRHATSRRDEATPTKSTVHTWPP